MIRIANHEPHHALPDPARAARELPPDSGGVAVPALYSMPVQKRLPGFARTLKCDKWRAFIFVLVWVNFRPPDAAFCSCPFRRPELALNLKI